MTDLNWTDPQQDDPWPPLQFGNLGMDLPENWREAAIHQAVEALKKLAPEALMALRTDQSDLREAQGHAQVAAQQLLQAPTLWQVIEADHPAFAALVEARRAGLQAEARLQHLTGVLSAEDLVRVVALRGVPSAGDAVCEVQIVHGTLTERLQGVLVIAPAAALADSAAPGRVMLFWPGRYGGLAAYPSLTHLLEVLQGTSDPTALASLVAIDGDPLQHSVRSQWLEWQLHAADISRGDRLFDGAPTSAQSLERLRQEALDDLTVSVNPARTRAMAQAFEGVRNGLLVEALPDWIKTASEAERLMLKGTLQDYLDAQRQVAELLDRDLPERARLVEQQVRARVAADFAVQGTWSVTLDLPRRVTWVREVIAGSGAPGVPSRRVPTASPERELISLEALALAGIDDTLNQRLEFVQVIVVAQLPATAQALQAGLTLPWLKTMVTTLDVAQQYESALYGAFKGMPGESAHNALIRRQVLAAPWRLRLQWQASEARAQGVIDEQAWQMINCAVLAESADDWRPEGWNLVLQSAFLLSGASAGLAHERVPLDGITFIHEKNSGRVVLHLPEAPNGKVFTGFDDLASARQGLMDMALRADFLDYLVHLPTRGEPAAHASYINQARLRRFDGYLEVGGE